MAKNSQTGQVIVYPAKGGLETISIPGTTTVGRLADGSNFIVDISGTKRKHPGIERRVDDESVNLTLEGNSKGLHDFWYTSGSNKVQKTVVIANGKLWADTNGNGTFSDFTGAVTITATDNVCVETFYGLMVMAFDNNPSDVPQYFDGTTLGSLGGTPPNAKYLRTWQNRLWAAGIGTAPDRLDASVIDDPEDWLTANGAEQINIDQGDQDPAGITALFPPLFGRMVVGKQRSLYAVEPYDYLFSTSQIVSGLGCISHNATIAVDNDIYFPSERGIHSLGMTEKYGEVETGYLTYPIQDWYQENISYRHGNNFRAVYAPEINSYLLAATLLGSARNNVVLGYNFALKEWFRWDEQVSAFAKYVDRRDGNKTKVLMLDDQGRVGIIDTRKGTRTVLWFGEQRTTQLTTGIIYPMGVTKEVTLSKMTCFYRPQVTGSDLTVSYMVNGKFVEDLTFSMEPLSRQSVVGSAVIGVDKIGGKGIVKHVTRQMKGQGTAIEIVFTHTPVADDDDFELYGFVIDYEYAGETEQPKTQ
jgi:hypothetical protein